MNTSEMRWLGGSILSLSTRVESILRNITEFIYLTSLFFFYLFLGLSYVITFAITDGIKFLWRKIKYRF